MAMRIGVVGTGWITEAFLSGAHRVPGLETAAVVSRSRERGEAFAARNGLPLVFTDCREMAGSGAVDGVYIASPNDCHMAQSRLFLEHGLHVLCEKPLAADPRPVEELAALAANKDLVFMEAIMLRHLPQRRRLRQAVNRLGALSAVHFDFCQYSSKYPAFLRGETPNIFNPLHETGALMDLGVYCVYPALWLFGEPQGVEASASFLRTGADGSGAALLRYPGFSVTLSYSKTGQSASPSQIVGEEGTVSIGAISTLSDMVLHERGKEPAALWGSEDKAVLMGYEAADFYRAAACPEEWRRKREKENALALGVCRCLREIRRRAGITFPSDRENA